MNTTTTENGTNERKITRPRWPAPGERERVVAEWAASGKTVEEMAAQTGWSTHTLYRWRLDVRHGRGGSGATPSRPKLLPVPKPASGAPGAWAAEVAIGTGISMRLSAVCPPAWVGQLVRELKSC
jgi:transposase-like protein